MLVLHLKKNSRVSIGQDIILEVLKVGESYIKVGFDAPKGTRILREETIKKMLRQNGGAIRVEQDS